MYPSPREICSGMPHRVIVSMSLVPTGRASGGRQLGGSSAGAFGQVAFGYFFPSKCSRAEGDKRIATDQGGHLDCRAEGMNSCTPLYPFRRQHFGEEDNRHADEDMAAPHEERDEPPAYSTCQGRDSSSAYV
jgi:hypothetical protein